MLIGTNTFIQTNIPILFLKLHSSEENTKAEPLMPTLVMKNYPLFVCGHLLIVLLESPGS